MTTTDFSHIVNLVGLSVMENYLRNGAAPNGERNLIEQLWKSTFQSLGGFDTGLRDRVDNLMSHTNCCNAAVRKVKKSSTRRKNKHKPTLKSVVR